MKMSLIMIYDLAEKNILMCLRAKDPYKGLYNLVGGKLEPNEKGIDCAYRELFEETGITKDDTILTYLMDFKYYMSDVELQVYVGKLNKEVELIEEKNKLYWIDADSDFYDMSKFAGEGNIAHMVEQVKYYGSRLLKEEEKV